jgi:hypothetical protein
MNHSDPVILDLEPVERPEREASKPNSELSVSSHSPAGMMMQALGRGASLQDIAQMLTLQERWEAGEARKAYNVAFAAFKAEAVHIVKNRQVTDGPLRGKSYAELHAVVDALTPALSRHGLSASWKLTKDEPQWMEVTCTLRHVNGHEESVSMGGPPDAGGAKNAIQARASTKSYLERYTLKAICGVAEGGEDDDGNGGRDQPKEIPPELLKAAQDAAMGGWKALSTWIRGRSESERKLLEPESAKLKEAAKAADAKG